jgi:hypothetical protein
MSAVEEALAKRRGFAPKARTAIAAAAALALAGCGGGGETTTTSVATTRQSGGTESQTQKPKPSGAGQSSNGGSAAKPRHGGPKQPSTPAPTDPGPLPNQGTKVVAPGVPISKGGDNSIQAYGLESASEDRVQAASSAKAYLDAQAAGQWARACSYLTVKVRASLEGLGKQAKGCAGAMATLLAKAPKATLRTAADIHVISMRVKSDQAFVIYRDASGTAYNLPLNREGGNWRVGALAGIALVS